jgi:uncharacterized protein YecE (DUF72 family)
MLPFYTSRLNSVELNTTFYHWPKPSSVQAWAAAAPDGFRFAIKAHRWLANPLNVERFEAGLPELTARYGELGAALGPLLFKLPPPAAASTERLGRFLRLVPAGWRVAFEFGHPSWESDGVTRLLEDAGAAACAVDEGLEAPSPRGAYVYVRLRHDRYGPKALVGWAERIAAALADGRDAYVYFKHQAARPARAERLRTLVQTSARPAPRPGV